MYAVASLQLVVKNDDLCVQTTTVFDNFLAAKAAGDPDAVRILDALRLRYFSPDELLGIFCFVDVDHPSFVWPSSTTTKSKYRLLGNSVNVKVVSALLEYLLST
jgi:tRNA (cytosine38-C5)-methyltransferase